MKYFSIIVTAFLLGVLNKAYSQAEEIHLHLVMAYVDYEERIYGDRYYPPEPEYLKILFRLESDSLVVVDTLNSERGLKMNLLMNYPEQKLIYFEEIRIDGGIYPDAYSMLCYGDSLVMTRFRPEWDTSFFEHKLPLVLIEKNGKYLMNNEWDIKGRLEYDDYARDFYFNKYKLEPNDFQDPIMPRWPGMQRAFPMGFVLKYIDDNFDELRIPRGDKPVAQIQLPDSLKEKDIRYFYPMLNNARYCAGGWQRHPGDTADATKIFILDKSNDEWHSLWLEGKGLNFMNWEDWLYGTIKRKLPPLEKRIEVFDRYNGRYDEQFGKPDYLSRRPGIHYLYHIPTRKYIEWNMGDPDSEIILINDGKIYYRIFDEIRMVGLNTRKREIDWPSDKLIIKNKKIVPNVHWMFFAPKMDMKEVWVNRPERE